MAVCRFIYWPGLFGALLTVITVAFEAIVTRQINKREEIFFMMERLQIVNTNVIFLSLVKQPATKNLLHMKTKILIFCLLVSSSLFAQKKEKDKVLVNKTYTVEFTETGAKKPKPVSDEISFKSNKLNSKFM